MPRTKRPVRKQEKSSEENDVLLKLNKLVTDHKKKIDSRADMEVRNVELAFKILLGSISKTYLQMTVGELKTEMHLKELTKTRGTRHSSKSAASHDDGYLTENSSQGSGERGVKKIMGSRLAPPSSSRSTCRRSRSADASSRPLATPAPPTATATATKTSQRRRSRSVYRTPAYNKKSTYNYPPITPKVAPNCALAVLRQPRQGEMVVSMSGSPVMVPTCYNMRPDEMANCNILLEDGTMLSLQPKQLRQSQAYIPFSLMSSNMLDQLNTLKNNLDNIVKIGQKVIK